MLKGTYLLMALFIYLNARLVVMHSLGFEVDYLKPTRHGTLRYSYQEVHGMTSWEGVLGSIVDSEMCLPPIRHS